MTILAANHLSKSYGKRPVVKDVSFSVSQGEVVGLLGTQWRRQNNMFLHDYWLGKTGRRSNND
jgi:ABC-type lipopolysaccharide export system ATPase subunit